MLEAEPSLSALYEEANGDMLHIDSFVDTRDLPSNIEGVLSAGYIGTNSM